MRKNCKTWNYAAEFHTHLKEQLLPSWGTFQYIFHERVRDGRKKEVIKDECKWTISVIHDFSVIVKRTSIFWFSLSFRKLQFKKELSCILLEVLFMVTLAGLFLGLYLEISRFLLFQMIQKLDKAQKLLMLTQLWCLP